jgi:hypothetical protein
MVNYRGKWLRIKPVLMARAVKKRYCRTARTQY